MMLKYSVLKVQSDNLNQSDQESYVAFGVYQSISEVIQRCLQEFASYNHQ